MSRTPRATPVELTPEPWPDSPSDDPYAEIARQFVVRLRNGIDTRSIRSVGAAAGVSHVTILNVLAGRAWPDLSTIARLEVALGVPLWPGLQIPTLHDEGSSALE